MKPTFRLTVRITEELAKRMKIYAADTGLSLQEVAARALDTYLPTVRVVTAKKTSSKGGAR